MSNYYTVESGSTDMKKSCSYVNAYIFPSHIQAVGVSYARHFKTIAELKNEIEVTEKAMKNPVLNEEYLELEFKLQELQHQLADRKKDYKPRNRKSKLRVDNMKCLNVSQNNLMLYMYGNFDVQFALMGTMTYKEKVYDMKITVQDFQQFRKKFYRKFPNAVWIAVYEYHADGSTHIHFVFRNATRSKS